MARVGLKQLAAQLGVDVSTVSRALRNDPRVKPETTASVRRLADELGYRPNTAARALKGGRTGRVAVLLSPPQQRFASPIFLELLATLDNHLRQQALSLTVFAARERGEELGIVRSVVEDRLADGIVLGRTTQDDQRVRFLLDAEYPFITFGRTSWQDEHSWVEIDYAKAGELAVAALATSEPDAIEIVSAPEGLRFADNYVTGALREAERRGIDVPRLTRVDMTEGQGEMVATERLPMGRRQGFACIQDSLAFGFYRAATQLDRRIGEDVALFGGQNFPGSEHAAPPLSTFSTQDTHVADLLSRVMLNRLFADTGFAPEHHVIEPTVLLRRSHQLDG